MEFVFMSIPFRFPLLSLLQFLLETLFLGDVAGQAGDTRNPSRVIPNDIAPIPDVPDFAIGANDAIFGIIAAPTDFLVEEGESAVVILGMNGVEPGMGIGVHSAARTPPNRFVGRADV